jgi:hypothetical protein
LEASLLHFIGILCELFQCSLVSFLLFFGKSIELFFEAT